MLPCSRRVCAANLCSHAVASRRVLMLGGALPMDAGKFKRSLPSPAERPPKQSGLLPSRHLFDLGIGLSRRLYNHPYNQTTIEFCLTL